ncbi:MAG: NrsF family protein [Methylocystis sp.]|jgi:hypothetical protein
MIRRGAPIAPMTTTGLATLAATSIAAAALLLFHEQDASVMVLVWLGARLDRARRPLWPAAFALANGRSDPHRKRPGSALLTCSYQ